MSHTLHSTLSGHPSLYLLEIIPLINPRFTMPIFHCHSILTLNSTQDSFSLSPQIQTFNTVFADPPQFSNPSVTQDETSKAFQQLNTKKTFHRVLFPKFPKKNKNRSSSKYGQDSIQRGYAESPDSLFEFSVLCGSAGWISSSSSNEKSG